MELIADILLGGGAIGAGLYCYVLSRKLAAFTALENGMGGAIAVLSAQVDDMTKTLDRARAAAGDSTHRLTELTERAEVAARRLELLVASLHDLPEARPPDVQRTRVLRSRERRHRAFEGEEAA